MKLTMNYLDRSYYVGIGSRVATTRNFHVNKLIELFNLISLFSILAVFA